MDEIALKEELLKLIKEKAVVAGKRKLASGKDTDVYIDGKLLTLDPQGILIVSKTILGLLSGVQAEAIGGPTLGADPIVSAVSLLSSQTGRPLKAFIVRKQVKQHGMEKMIEGPALEEGERVVMVEDVVTTGDTVLAAIKEVEKTKARIVKVICLVDREEGAGEKLGPYNYSPIFTLKELNL